MFLLMLIETISPNWPLSKRVCAYVTNRFGGFSENEYFSFNLAGHVKDNYEHVMQNRNLLVTSLSLPQQPIWLSQCHTGNVLEIPIDKELYEDYFTNWQISQLHPELAEDASELSKLLKADAVFTKQDNQVALVLTADCVPILLCNQSETACAAVHAGWQGILNGIVQNSVFMFKENQVDFKDDPLYAWIGPCIGPQSFQVGPELMAKFVEADEDFVDCFTPDIRAEGKWLGDLPAICRVILQKCGVAPANIYGCNIDTMTDDKYFSYRRDKVTGRFATLIWLDSQAAR